MPSFGASIPALTALVALESRPAGMRLSELARLAGKQVSTMQRALALLASDGLVLKSDHRYLSAGSPRGEVSVAYALAWLQDEPLVRALSANLAVELIGFAPEGLVVVAGRFPEPRDHARLRRVLDLRRGARPDTSVDILAHHEIPARLLADPDTGERLRALSPVIGEIERILPHRSQHTRRSPSVLGRLNPQVRGPSKGELERFATRHGLRRLVAFGSSVRDDFDPSSDVDLLVEPAPGVRPGLLDVSDMTADATQLFERDVDIVVGPPGQPTLRTAIEREGVTLHDAR